MAEATIGGVPFSEAADAFKNKKLVPTKYWDEILGKAHGQAFMVAGVMQIDMLNDFKKAIEDIRSEGGTSNDFLKNFKEISAQYGWDFNGEPGWRSKLIFDTNMRTANASGRWQQIQRRQAALKKRDPNATLYMTYRVLDHGLNRRPLHQQWNEITLPVDHPWWDEHYPPNDFGCACSIRIRTQRDIDNGIATVTENPPKIIRTQRVNKRSGEVYPPTPEGIGVGWNHHHGKSTYFPTAANIVDDRLGKKVAEISLNSPLAKEFISGNLQGNMLVGYLPDGLPELIGANTARVFLSQDSAVKQSTKRSLSIDDYKRLPDVFSNGLVIKQAGQWLVFLHDDDSNKLWQATVKSTKDGNELYLASYRRANQQNIKQAKKKGTVVRDEL